jgi:hypothetical protein
MSGLRRSVPLPCAGRVDEHGVHALAVSLQARIALVRELEHAHVACTGAREALSHAIETSRGHVEGVHASAILHEGARVQRLAAAARAEVDDALAGTRREQERHELAALVLHLETTRAEGRRLEERFALAPAQSLRRVRRRTGRVAAGGELGLQRVACGLQCVGAEVDGRGREQCLRERLRLVGPLLTDRVREPVGKGVAHGEGQLARVRPADRARQLVGAVDAESREGPRAPAGVAHELRREQRDCNSGNCLGTGSCHRCLRTRYCHFSC